MKQVRILAATGAVLAALSSFVTGPAQAGRSDQTLSTPVYNEESKSYFAVMRVPKGMTTWPRARAAVRSLTFHGVRGEMATVNSRDIMKFLHDNMKIRYAAWIGARLVCKGRRLLWEDGRIQDQGDFSYWHPRWKRTYIGCPNVAFMPVYMLSSDAGSYWQASGPHKGFGQAVVEFRTGKP